MNPRIRTLLNVLAALALVAGAVSFCAFVIHTQRIGGSVTNGVFYSDHGIPPAHQPSQADIDYGGRLTNLMCFTIPLTVVALFYIFKTEIFPRFYTRGSYDEAVAAVAVIRGSGAPIFRAWADAFIGGTDVGGYRSLVIEVYSGGLVLFRHGSFGPFGVGTEEIRSAGIARRYGKTGLLIWHNGKLGNPLFIYHASRVLIDAVLSIIPTHDQTPTDSDRHPRAA